MDQHPDVGRVSPFTRHILWRRFAVNGLIEWCDGADAEPDASTRIIPDSDIDAKPDVFIHAMSGSGSDGADLRGQRSARDNPTWRESRPDAARRAQSTFTLAQGASS